MRKGKLSESQIKNASVRAKAYKLFDGQGLFLFVPTNGSRLWRLKYRMGGRERLLAIGSYPQISLVEARAKRNEARKLIAEGIDPVELRRTEKRLALSIMADGIDRLLALPEVEYVTGLKRVSIYNMAGRGEFPKPRKVTPRASRWLESEIREWIASRPSGTIASPNPKAKAHMGLSGESPS